MTRSKFRPNYGNIIKITFAFAATASVVQCTSFTFFERSQSDTVYQMGSVHESTKYQSYGYLKVVDPNLAGEDQWENESELRTFVFKLKNFSPNDFKEGKCFQPVTSGSLIGLTSELHQINPVPCPSPQ